MWASDDLFMIKKAYIYILGSGLSKSLMNNLESFSLL